MIHIDNWTVARILLQVEVSHSDFAEISRMELVHEDSVMMLTSSQTSTSRMLSVLSDSAMTVTHVSSHLSAFLLLVSGLHFSQI